MAHLTPSMEHTSGIDDSDTRASWLLYYCFVAFFLSYAPLVSQCNYRNLTVLRQVAEGLMWFSAVSCFGFRDELCSLVLEQAQCYSSCMCKAQGSILILRHAYRQCKAYLIAEATVNVACL